MSRRGRTDVLVVVLLVAVAAAVRVPALAPSSLWLDDAWAALVVRAHGWHDLALVAVTAPGWTVGLAGWLGLTGLSSLAAQAPAFVAGVLGPGLCYLVGLRLRLSRWAAVLAAALLLSSPIHIIYSTRVKPYTIDAVLVLAVLWVAAPLLTDPDRARRWGALVAVAALGTVVSAPVAVAMAAAVAAGVVAGWRAGRGLRSALAAGGAYLVFGLVWWRLVLAPQVADGLRDYWAPQMLATRSVGAFAHSLGAALVRVAETLSWVPPWLTLTVGGLALLALAVRRPRQALLLAGPLLVAIVLAALGRVPLGGRRTDTYLLPALALLVAAGVEAARELLVGVPARRIAAGVVGVAAVAVGVGAAWHLPHYPAEDVRPLVAEAEAQRAPDEPIVVYPATRWAYALYTSTPVRLVPNPESANGFEVVLDHAGIRVLGPHRDDPEAFRSGLAGMVDDAGRVWFVASHWGSDLDVLEQQFRTLGFQAARREQRDGALLVVWARSVGR